MGGLGKPPPYKSLPHPLWGLGSRPLALDPAFHLSPVSQHPEQPLHPVSKSGELGVHVALSSPCTGQEGQRG